MKKLALCSPCSDFTTAVIKDVAMRIGRDYCVLADEIKNYIAAHQPAVSKIWNQSTTSRQIYKQDIIIESAKRANAALVLFDMTALIHPDVISLLKGKYYFCSLKMDKSLQKILSLEEKTLYNEYTAILERDADYTVTFNKPDDTEALLRVREIAKEVTMLP